MKILGSSQLTGKMVVSQDGADVGEVQGLDVNVETWKVETLEIKLERDVLEKLNLKKPIFGTQSVRISTDRISGVSDTVVLKNTVKEIAFVDSPEPTPKAATSATEA